jgi:hypothetical protein
VKEETKKILEQLLPLKQGPVLILLRGLPGAGKSTLTKEIVSSFSIQTAVEVIDPDAITPDDPHFQNFKAEDSEPDREKVLVYRYNSYRAIQFLTLKKIVIWDQVWSKLDGLVLTVRKILGGLVGVGEDNFRLPIFVMEIHYSAEQAYIRVEGRNRKGKDLPIHIFEKYVNNFRHIESDDPLFQKIFDGNLMLGELEPYHISVFRCLIE